MFINKICDEIAEIKIKSQLKNNTKYIQKLALPRQKEIYLVIPK